MSRQEDFQALKARRNERLKAMAALSAKMKPEHILFANNVMDGMTPTDAFRKLTPRNANDPHASKRGSTLRNRDDVKQYVELMKQEAIDSAMNRVQFTEEDWLRRQLEIQSKALGEIPTAKAFVIDGQVVETMVLEDNLTQANKTQELLGKRFGLLTDKVESSRTTLKVKDMTGRKKEKKSDKPH